MPDQWRRNRDNRYYVTVSVISFTRNIPGPWILVIMKSYGFPSTTYIYVHVIDEGETTKLLRSKDTQDFGCNKWSRTLLCFREVFYFLIKKKLIRVWMYMKCKNVFSWKSSTKFDNKLFGAYFVLKIETGVKQGYILSGFLFLLIIDWIMRNIVRRGKNGIRWHFTTKLDDLDNADNISLIYLAKNC